jgi:hypothetical protein
MSQSGDITELVIEFEEIKEFELEVFEYLDN